MVEPLIRRFAARPQGGGSVPVDDRAVFTAIVFVLTSGCAWRHLPPSFGVTVPTAHRRLDAWAAAGVFEKLHREVLDLLGSAGELDWTAAILNASSVQTIRNDRIQPRRSRQEGIENPRPVQVGGILLASTCRRRIPGGGVPMVFVKRLRLLGVGRGSCS